MTVMGHAAPVRAALARMGVEVDDELVRAWMRELGLMPVQVKRRRGLTVADKAAGPSPRPSSLGLLARGPVLRTAGGRPLRR